MLIEPLDTVEAREDALQNTLGSMAIEVMKLDPASIRIWRRWVRGEITLDAAGALLDDRIYRNCPGARLP